MSVRIVVLLSLYRTTKMTSVEERNVSRFRVTEVFQAAGFGFRAEHCREESEGPFPEAGPRTPELANAA